MRRSWSTLFWSLAIRQRRRLRESEAAFILLAILAGVAAGLITNLLQLMAHGIQELLYGVSINRLSALGEIRHPWRLLGLPLGGLALVLLARLLRRRQRPLIDVVEANALHGGRIPMADNLVIAGQTVLSNGAGASVGLEAAYAQMGGGVASLLGQWLKLRRNDLRTLVGAGAGAGVGAAFGAPLAGAFYAFEIVIGHYTPAAIAPVVAAALSAAFVTRALGVEPWLIATTADRILGTADYLLYALLGLVCAGLGILIMRMVTFAELRVQGWTWPGRWRPVIGGMLLMPLAWLTPQTLSAGHGALHLNLILLPDWTVLLMILCLKIAASVISLSFGFRGGLFFASLFLGSVTREMFGYSFSTWRLHLRGSTIRSPRDIGWVMNLTAGRMMRRDWVSVPDTMSVGQFRALVPLGSASKAIMIDGGGGYRGIVPTAAAYRPELAEDAPIAPLATMADISLRADADIRAILPLFDKAAADELAVVDESGLVLGVLTEKHARRRYFEEIESSQRALFGEG
ncbi:chloride channel protein [Sphingobium sp. IP1]|uniref:chloride channel protein n=1 Tax=Sphingobium sp. IP1 TaxID=2021637 RepID=UPI000C07BC93|nr:chloride channel protein [Sphingobium sp. IP1]PHP18127.1 chloride channel protein [Sphingobium sp. IP1]